MEIFDAIHTNFRDFKVQQLSGRYITNTHIVPLIAHLPIGFSQRILGYSELNTPIYGITFGSGPIKILVWSQMHGNESTCTKAIFDAIFSFDKCGLTYLSKKITLKIIPILNPDGAQCYTRFNSNGIDLNRDAIDLSQKESRVLNHVFNSFKPDFCFNMHDQRTLFSAGNYPKSATVSFLSPSEDKQRSMTPTRQIAMAVITQMNAVLQRYIPGQVGRYSDEFNINCVGDFFQSKGVPTILFEAGHYEADYNRDETRLYILLAFLKALTTTASPITIAGAMDVYHQIPENHTLFYDLLINNAILQENEASGRTDIGLVFDEILTRDQIKLVPKIQKTGNLSSCFGHRTIDAKGQQVVVDPVRGAVSVGSRTFTFQM